MHGSAILGDEVVLVYGSAFLYAAFRVLGLIYEIKPKVTVLIFELELPASIVDSKVVIVPNSNDACLLHQVLIASSSLFRCR